MPPIERKRILHVKDPKMGLEARITINNPGMDKLNPLDREAMKSVTLGFLNGLRSSVDKKSLSETEATTRDVLFHIAHRLQQVALTAMDKSLTINPEKTEPTGIKQYVRELADASIATQDGIDRAKARLILYAQTCIWVSDTIETLEQSSDPKEREAIGGMQKIAHAFNDRAAGVDDALRLITGDKPKDLPAHLQSIIDYFIQHGPPESSKDS